MSEIYLYDSLSNKKKKFEPIDQNHVRIYACGPTVYNYAHIGNARMAVVFDSFVRLLRNKYPNVTYVSNITDIDDKIIEAANESNIPINELTKKYTDIYNADMSYLNVLHPDIQPKATEYVEDMIYFIDKLIQKDKAYEKDGHVFFHVPSHEGYGKLSNREIDQQLAGSRVQVSDIKKNQQDFVLWKPSSKSQPGWESPWGVGRPGWHTECCVMSEVNLKIPFDIHGGGQDLLFPHHENEIAQSCASVNSDNPEDYAKYWIHNGFVTIDGEKMSKSLGNFRLVGDLLEIYPGEVLRYAILTAQYRSEQNFDYTILDAAENSLNSLYRYLRAAENIEIPVSNEVASCRGVDALLDDLNTPLALSELHRIAKQMHSSSGTDQQILKAQVMNLSGLMGLLQQQPEDWFHNNSGNRVLTDRQIENAIDERKQAKLAGDYATADIISYNGDEQVKVGREFLFSKHKSNRNDSGQ